MFRYRDLVKIAAGAIAAAQPAVPAAQPAVQPQQPAPVQPADPPLIDKKTLKLGERKPGSVFYNDYQGIQDWMNAYKGYLPTDVNVHAMLHKEIKFGRGKVYGDKRPGAEGTTPEHFKAHGVAQIHKINVDELNRLMDKFYGNRPHYKFTYEDRMDPGKALDMYRMQSAMQAKLWADRNPGQTRPADFYYGSWNGGGIRGASEKATEGYRADAAAYEKALKARGLYGKDGMMLPGSEDILRGELNGNLQGTGSGKPVRVYTVKPGDTIFGLRGQLGGGLNRAAYLEMLKRHNKNLDPNRIRVGQQLIYE